MEKVITIADKFKGKEYNSFETVVSLVNEYNYNNDMFFHTLLSPTVLNYSILFDVSLPEIFGMIKVYVLNNTFSLSDIFSYVNVLPNEEFNNGILIAKEAVREQMFDEKNNCVSDKLFNVYICKGRCIFFLLKRLVGDLIKLKFPLLQVYFENEIQVFHDVKLISIKIDEVTFYNKVNKNHVKSYIYVYIPLEFLFTKDWKLIENFQVNSAIKLDETDERGFSYINGAQKDMPYFNKILELKNLLLNC